jgi:hypothetical protein
MHYNERIWKLVWNVRGNSVKNSQIHQYATQYFKNRQLWYDYLNILNSFSLFIINVGVMIADQYKLTNYILIGAVLISVVQFLAQILYIMTQPAQNAAAHSLLAWQNTFIYKEIDKMFGIIKFTHEFIASVQVISNLATSFEQSNVMLPSAIQDDIKELQAKDNVIPDYDPDFMDNLFHESNMEDFLVDHRSRESDSKTGSSDSIEGVVEVNIVPQSEIQHYWEEMKRLSSNSKPHSVFKKNKRLATYYSTTNTINFSVTRAIDQVHVTRSHAYYTKTIDFLRKDETFLEFLKGRIYYANPQFYQKSTLVTVVENTCISPVFFKYFINELVVSCLFEGYAVFDRYGFYAGFEFEVLMVPYDIYDKINTEVVENCILRTSDGYEYKET